MGSMSNLLQWVITELSSLLQFPVTEDMARCILMIESNRDLEEYLQTLLDMSNPTHQKFVIELKQKKQISQGYKKVELDNYIQNKSQEKKKKGNKNKQETKKNDQQEEPSHSGSGKHKNKFVNILAAELSDGMLLKGRHICNCQASKHSLINNCLKCGRIVCEQEGSGPCFFCKNVVCGRDEDSGKIKKNSKAQPDQLNSSLESALELRDRLLEYDKTSERRTHVIDDESDYFSTNSVWLTKEQREKFQKKVEELRALKNSRGKQQLRVDFTGRYIVEDETLTRSINQETALLDEITEMFSQSRITEEGDLDPKSTMEIHPVYLNDGGTKTGARWHNVIGRVQDSQVMEMSDTGMCLSMHQPWASLLVTGIKEHEGRSWYSSHRGRLWIAAASKIPTSEEISDVENQYRLLRGGDIKFPARYPSGCLLGCVNVVDCLAQEEYCDKYPHGESDDPFVFICTNPIKCPVMFPMQGKHKIYKLDSKIHQAAAKCIQKLSSSRPP